MTDLKDEKFHILTGLVDDSCYLNEVEVENQKQSKYLHRVFGDVNKANHLAVENYLIPSNTNGLLENNNINVSNSLIFNSQNTHPDVKLDLASRPYATIPYLGRGKVHVSDETSILRGEEICLNKKSLQPENHGQRVYPMIKEIEEKITNPKYLVEDADNEWIRGGLPTREMNREYCDSNK